MKRYLAAFLLLFYASPAFAGWYGWGAGWGEGDRRVDKFTVDFEERDSVPPTPTSNRIKLYAADDGAGVTTLFTIDSTGSSTAVGAGNGGTPRMSFVLDTPTTASDYNMGSFPEAITIQEIRVLAVGGTNIVGGLQECNASGASCSAVDSDITASTGTVATDDGSLSNATIDADDQLQWLTTSVSGTVTSATVTIYYTVD